MQDGVKKRLARLQLLETAAWEVKVTKDVLALVDKGTRPKFLVLLSI